MRSKTETMHHTRNAVNREGWQGITYAAIEEYDALPKIDKREYVMRCVAANQKIQAMIPELTSQFNAKLKERDDEAKKLADKLAEIQAKWWFKIAVKLGL